MKISYQLIFISLLVLQTNAFSQKTKQTNARADTLKVDSLEYELVIIDPGFDSWLATQPPRDFYSNDYYASKNRLYVSEWNQRYMSGRRRDLFESYVDYNPNIDYDIDLNYRLYYYFRYFEEKNGIKLINSAR
jgi:hypothetical protein